MRILITMSRTWTDDLLVWRLLDGELAKDPNIVIVHGGAQPEKRLIETWAFHRYAEGHHRVSVMEFPARWHEEGRGAGILRNIRMIDSGVDLCLAFIHNASRGATHCATAAAQHGIETRVERLTSH